MTYVGKKLLKEQADKWKHCMKTKSQVRTSLQACLRPSMADALVSCVSDTWSFSMREWARFLSRSLSQRVVRGVLGRSQKPRRPMNAVIEPSMMKSLQFRCQSRLLMLFPCVLCGDECVEEGPYHRQPARPRTPFILAKMPAAMRPEKPVARIWEQYNIAMRAATSICNGQYVVQ